MKITFTCKLTMTDELEDSEVENVYPADVIAKELIKDLKNGLTEKGTADISNYQSLLNNNRNRLVTNGKPIMNNIKKGI